MLTPTTKSRAHVRDATIEDGPALQRLSKACTQNGEMALRIEREPDFFALSRLAGDPWRVILAEGFKGEAIGCISFGRRRVYLASEPCTLISVGDLKVHPDHRGPAVDAANQLMNAFGQACRAMGGDELPVAFTVLSGNRRAEYCCRFFAAKFIPGVHPRPLITRLATLHAYSIPLLWGPRFPRRDLRVEEATWEDVPEMIALWRRRAPRMQCADVHDEHSFTDWVRSAPDLDVSSYRLVRNENGRLEGFLGLWNQGEFKQLRVLGYARRLKLPRLAFNAVARLAWAAPLPQPGGELGVVSTVHLCTPLDDPTVLRTLILDAIRGWRGRGCSVLQLSLDVKDPRTSAVRGLFAQPTTVNAYVASPAGTYRGPALDDSPMHHEIALV